MQIETVRTPEFTMDYCRFGSGSRPMVILPGLSVKSVMLSAPAVEKEYGIMKSDFTVYLFDRRSDLPEAYTIADMARDTAAAMQALGLNDVCLFGASQGGMIAMTIAIEHPQLVSKLAVASTAASMLGERGEVLSRWRALAAAGDVEALFLDFARAVYPPELYAQYRDAFIMLARTTTPEELMRFCILSDAAVDFSVLDRLGGITCPVLVLSSADDGVLGSDAGRELAERLRANPGLVHHEYSGFGHAAYDTAPDARERLYSFFK